MDAETGALLAAANLCEFVIFIFFFLFFWEMRRRAIKITKKQKK